ncbi:nuclear mRNA export, poly(A)+RNA binding protein, partial [Linnemannia gamsii]
MKYGINDGQGGQSNLVARTQRFQNNGNQGNGQSGGRGGWGDGSGNNFRQENGQGQLRGGVVVYPRYNERKNTTTFLVSDLEQAKALVSLSGIRFKTFALSITTSTSLNGQDGDRQDKFRFNDATIEAVRAYIRSCYNGGFLKMERMASSPILRQAHVAPPGQNHGRRDTGPLFFKIAAELFPNAYAISLAFNGLSSLRPVSSIAQYFPDLQQLSLLGNNISSLDELQYLYESGPLPYLRELILLDNPVRDESIQAHGNDAMYRSNVEKMMKSLSKLDENSIVNISFGVSDLDYILPTKVALAAPVRTNFFDNNDTKSTILEFLTSKICVDAWQMEGLFPGETCIFASVHGEYEEYRGGPIPSRSRKSFDRTFILAPVPKDSMAAQRGWKCMIVSDQLMVRDYQGCEAWKPEPVPDVDPSLAAAIDRIASSTAFSQAASTTAPNLPDGM